MSKGFQKGYKPSPEHKERIRQAALERWRLKKLKADPKALGDTSCSLCVEFAKYKDNEKLKPNCKMGDGCVIRVIWSRFLTKFTRIKEKS